MTNDMKPDKNELISSLTDDHRDGLSVDNELREIASDPALSAKWSRYHLIRDVIQKDYSPILTTDFASRVSEAIAEEPAILAPRQSEATPSATVSNLQEARESKSVQTRSSTGSRNLKGFALAASVALMALVGLNVFQNQNDPANADIVALGTSNPIDSSSGGAPNEVTSGSSQIAVEQAGIVVNNGSGQLANQLEYVANSGTYWVSVGENTLSPANEQRLNMYLSQHMETSPTSGVQGILPYSRLAGYDSATARKRLNASQKPDQ